MTRIAIIVGHPDPDPRRLSHVLAAAYQAGAEADHEVRTINVAEMNFPLLRNAAEWQSGDAPADILRAQETILWAEHLVFIYPIWLGDVPALFKGFLEQVTRGSFAIAQSERGFPTKKLKGRSARIIVTMGMPGIMYRLLYRAHSVKSLKRSILNLAGVAPVKVTIIGNVGDKEQCVAALDRVQRLGERAA